MDAATLPGGSRIANQYELFQSELPRICELIGLDENELVFNDLTMLISVWLLENQGTGKPRRVFLSTPPQYSSSSQRRSVRSSLRRR